MPDSFDKFKVAKYWNKKEKTDTINCFLCPRGCVIGEGEYGFCNVRYNYQGCLYSLVYGYPAALQVDPIEKKPFAEFSPGTRTFSIGTPGCNLNCLFCQNYHLSRGRPNLRVNEKDFISPEIIVKSAINRKCSSVAFTYNEPTVWIEYAVDIASEAKKNGLEAVLVSNGYINPEPADELYSVIDAANIDMKGFFETFYNSMTEGKLKPVLKSIELLHSKGKHVELTNLVIPGKNDSEDMIRNYLDWVEANLDKNIPLHFSAYYPMYKFKESPRTSPEILFRIRDYAEKRGFTSIYLGNI